MNLQQAYLTARDKLRQHRCLGSDPEREAAELLAFVSERSRSEPLTHPEIELTEVQSEQLNSFLARRLQHEPIERIIGQSSFDGLNLEITAATLVPRPASEILVRTAATALQTELPEMVIDVGTGSGCLAIALARRLADVCLPAGREIRILATDTSSTALVTARQNAAANQTGDRIEFLAGDLLTPATDQIANVKSWSVVTNLPYVPDEQCDKLAPDVRDFDPPSALFGGPDGLNPYRRLLDQIAGLPGCESIFLECLPEQLTDLKREIDDRLDRAETEPILSGDGPAAIPVGLKAKLRR